MNHLMIAQNAPPNVVTIVELMSYHSVGVHTALLLGTRRHPLSSVTLGAEKLVRHLTMKPRRMTNQSGATPSMSTLGGHSSLFHREAIYILEKIIFFEYQILTTMIMLIWKNR